MIYLKKYKIFMIKFFKKIKNRFFNTTETITLKSILEKNYYRRKKFTFIQVGANDGISFDFLYDFVIKRKSRGLVIEPIKEYFDELVENYLEFPLILKINKAIHLSEKEINIYKILPESANKYPDWVKGIASFDKDHHKKVKIDSKDIIVEKVVSEKLMTIISDNYIYEQLDYFQIDTEGYDYEILKMLDFNMLKPKIIKFEIVNLNELDFELSKKLLLNQGYYLIKEGNDMVAIDLKRIKLK